MPNTQELVELKSESPEAYAAWLRMIEKRSDHDMWMEKAPYQLPATIAKRGQSLGLTAVVAVLILAAWALYLDHAWIAAFLGAVDIIGLAAVFSNNQGGAHRKK